MESDCTKSTSKFEPMNAQELRIGNLFNPIDRAGRIHIPVNFPYKVFTIEPFKVTACPMDQNFASSEMMIEYDIVDISSISITKDWLLKFGAIIPHEDTPDIFQIGLFEFVLDHEGLCLYDRESLNKLFGAANLKYIHQLQNLFFALTGKELNLNQ
jgi:hypothetical protein